MQITGERTLDRLRSELRNLMLKVSRIDLGTTYHLLGELAGTGEESLVGEAINSMLATREIFLERRRLGQRCSWVGLVRSSL